jgi:hypothetical protein
LRRRHRTSIEPLEERRLLTTGLAAFASFHDQVVAPNHRDAITIRVEPSDFRFPSNEIDLRFEVFGEGTAPLDPGKIRIRARSGAKVLGVLRHRDLWRSETSMALARMTAGTFVVSVGGERGTGGTYQLDVFLAGDVQGDFQVTRRDLHTIHSLFGVRRRSVHYIPGADVNGNGRIGPRDWQWARRNLGAGTTVRPLSLSVSVDSAGDPPGSTVVTQPNIVLVGQTEPGASVGLDQGDHGTFSGRTTADAQGRFHFAINVGLGVTPFRVFSSDTFGQHASFDLSVTRPPPPGTMPTVMIQSPGPNLLTHTNVTIAGLVTRAATLQAQVDSGSPVPVAFDSAGHFAFTTHLPLDGSADGIHTVQLTASDQAGDRSSPADYSFTLDTTPPVITVTSPSAGLTTSQNITVSGHVTDNLSGVATLQEAVDGGAYANLPFDASGNFQLTTALALDGSADGSHTVLLQASDRAGNISPVTRFVFTLDTQLPAVTITSAIPSLAINTNLTVTGQVTEFSGGVATLQASVDAGPPVGVAVDAAGNFTFSTSLPLDGSADGVHSIVFEAKDKAGHIVDAPVSFMLLTRPPRTPVFGLAGSSPGSSLTTTDRRVTLVGQTDPHVAVTLVGTGMQTVSTSTGAFQFPNVALSSGANPFTAEASDAAGTSDYTATITQQAATNQPNAVLVWNQAALGAIQQDATDPLFASRALAMVQAAVYDAVNAVEGTPAYYVKIAAPADASVDAAVDAAAHDVLSDLYPAQQASFDALLTSLLALLPAGQATTDGETVGQAAGNAIIAMRANDGSQSFVDFTPGTAAGDWQPTAPMYAPALDPQWANLKPFALTSPNQFDPAGPPALTSQQWADAVNQVESLGAVNSTTRTADQTQTAQFWNDASGTYTPPGHWNAISETVAQQQGDSLVADARLFAELDISLADAGITAWNTKYDYDTWRPITVIQTGGAGVNSGVTADPTWEPLLTTPNFPEYVSGHSTFSGAASTVLDAFFGDNISFSSTEPTLPGVTRSYTSFDQAAQEAGMSRIYAGIHFIFSDTDGLAAGQAVAQWDLATFTISQDTTPPTITLGRPLPGGATSRNFTLNGQVTDNLSGVATLTVQVDRQSVLNLTVDANGDFTFPTSFALDGSTDGKHVLKFVARDFAGNTTAPVDFSFILSTRSPALTITSPADGGSLATGATLTGTIAAASAPITALSYALDGGTSMPVAFNADGSFSQALDLSRLAAGNHTLVVTAQDAAGNTATQTLHLTQAAPIALTVTSLTPSAGSTDVGVTFRPKVTFSRPIDPTTLSSSNFYATDTTGAKLAATIVPSSDGSYAWLFFTNPMPGASTITLTVDGSTIKAADGSLLDAAGSGTPGSKLTSTFTTVSVAPVPGTTLSGILADPGPDLKPMTRDDVRVGPDGVLGTADDVYLRPIQGVKVYILGLESQAVTTDAQGRFSFSSVPTGDVKLALEGNTPGVTVYDPAKQKFVEPKSEGFYFPEMVMDLTIQPGVANTVMGTMGTTQEEAANATNLGLYLPRVQTSVLQTVSATQPTTVGLTGSSALDLTPEQQQELKLTVQPGSLVGMDGTKMATGQVGVSVVPPQLVMDMLPAGVLQHTFDITIQAPGVATFSTPATLTLPNVFNAAPGTKLDVLSFDHTTGRLVIIGTATVSADGSIATTDPGSGITHPGWHGLTPPGGPTMGGPCDSPAMGTIVGATTASTSQTMVQPVASATAATPGQLQATVTFDGLSAASFTDWIIGPDADQGALSSIKVHIATNMPAGVSWRVEPVGPLSGTLPPGTDSGIGTDFTITPQLDFAARTKGSKTRNNPLQYDVCVIADLRSQPLPPPLPCPPPQCTPTTDGNTGVVTVTDTIDQSKKAILAQEYEDYRQAFGNLPKHAFTYSVPALSQIGPVPAEFTRSDAYRPLAVDGGMQDIVKDVRSVYGSTYGGTGSVVVSSAYRNPQYNKAVGGVTNSVHQTGGAVDMVPSAPTIPNKVALYRSALDGGGPGTVLLEQTVRNAAGKVIKVVQLLPRNYVPPPPTYTFHVLGSSAVIQAQGTDGLPDTVASAPTGIDTDSTLVDSEGHRYMVQGDGFIAAGEPILFDDPGYDANPQPLSYYFGKATHVHADNGGDPPPVTSSLSYSTAAGFGSDPVIYYRFVLYNGFQEAGKVQPGQQIEDFLPPDTPYLLYLYQPSTNMSKVYGGQSAPSGQPTELGMMELDTFGGVDSNGDRIPDVGKIAIGLDPYSPDPNPLGISAAAALAAGLDPLGNFGVPTGVVASLSLQGQAMKVTLAGSTTNAQGQTAYVATGSYGLAIVDASSFQKPILLGQIRLNGIATDVSVDPKLGIAAVADNSGGLDLVDVSDPTQPKLLQTIPVSAGRVQVVDGLAYAAVGSALESFDLLAGGSLQTLPLSGGTITGLAHEGTMLYTMDSNNTLRAIDISGLQMVPRGSLTLTYGGGQLFVGNGIAYVPAASFFPGGFSTVDVNNPDQPKLISGPQTPSGVSAPHTAMVINGSGVGLIVGSVFGGANVLDVMDTSDPSDPTKTNAFLTRFSLPSPPNGVAIAAGIAFVADGSGGLEVANYLPFDTKGVPPTVSITSSVPGPNVVEGSRIPIQASVHDDVQVRNVELLVNGQVVQNAVSLPLDLSAVVPSLASGATSVSIQVRATDTGGDSSLSNVLTYSITPDTTTLAVASINPPDGASVEKTFRTVLVRFSKPVAAATITNDTVQVLDGNGNPVVPAHLEVRGNNTLAELVFDQLPVGSYQLIIHAPAVTDMAGHALGSSNIVSHFTVTDATIIWNNPAGGDWNNPSNWDQGRLPQADDNVVVAVPAKATVYSSGNNVINSLRSSGTLALSGGSLTVAASVENDGTLLLNGGTLVALGGVHNTGQVTIDAGSTLTFAGGSNYVQTAGTTTLAGGTINRVDSFSLTLESDPTTLAAALGPAGRPSPDVVTRLDKGGATGLNFVPADLGGFGTNTSVPPGAPGGTWVINIPPGDGESGFFETAFPLPSDFTTIQLNGGANVDDAGRFFVNGNPLSPSLSSGDPHTITEYGNATFSTTNAADFQGGANTILLADSNSGGGPSGAAFYASITYSTPATGGVEIQGGSLSGHGTINASVTSSGQVSPGSPTGILAINGDYTQTSSGILNVALGGLTPGTKYDQLVTSGHATLDGTLDITLINGFTPSAGDVFTILTYSAFSGQFATINGLTIGSGLKFTPNYQTKTFTLTVG